MGPKVAPPTSAGLTSRGTRRQVIPSTPNPPRNMIQPLKNTAGMTSHSFTRMESSGRSYVGSFNYPSFESPSYTLGKWKPEGTLIAHLSEHTLSVNAIRLSPDHSFFASASDDGTVKIWDGVRLERNVTSRSRINYCHRGKHQFFDFYSISEREIRFKIP